MARIRLLRELWKMLSVLVISALCKPRAKNPVDALSILDACMPLSFVKFMCYCSVPAKTNIRHRLRVSFSSCAWKSSSPRFLLPEGCCSYSHTVTRCEIVANFWEMVSWVEARENCLSFLLTIAYVRACVEAGIPHDGLHHHDRV